MANELGDTTLELNVDMAGYQSALSKAEGSADDFASNAERAGSKAEGAFDDAERGASKLGDTLGDVGKIAAGFVVGAGITQLPGALGGAVGLMDSATVSAGQLQAKLGLTSEEAGELGDIAQAVFANNFGENMPDVVNQLATIQAALDLPTDQLQAVSEDMFRITDAFGEMGAETPGLTEAVRAMKAAFPEMTEAEILDHIALSFQDGTGSAGDMLDSIREYPQHLKNIGLDATDMFNIMDEGMEKGAYNTDFLMDAMKEFGIRMTTVGDTGQEAVKKMFPEDEADRIIKQFAEGGEAGRAAFFEVQQALQDIEDPQERYTMGVELFGTKYEDMVGVMDTMDWDAIEQGTRDVAGATESLDAQYAGIQVQLEGYKRQLTVLMQDALGPYAPMVSGAISATAGFAGSIAPAIPAMMAMIPVLGAKAAAWGAVAVAMIAANLPLIAIVAAIGLVVGAIYLLVQNWDSVTAKVPILGVAVDKVKATFLAFVSWITGDFVGGITAGFDKVTGAIQSAISWVQSNWPLILAILTGPIGLAVLAIITYWDEIKGAFEAAIDFVIDIVTTGFDKVVELVTTAIAAVLDGIVAGWTAAEKFTVEILTAIITAVTTAWNTITTAITTALATILGVITGAWNGYIEFIRTALGTIETVARTGLDILTGVVSNAFNAIKLAVELEIQGVQNIWNTAVELVKTGGQGIRNALSMTKDAFVRFGEAGRDAIQWVIGKIESLIGWINNIPSMPSFSVGGGVPFVPGIATGIRNFAGGLALVGEEGPELVRLPRGTDVFNNGETRGIFSDARAVTSNIGGDDGEGMGGMIMNFYDANIQATTEQEARRAAGDFGWAVSLRARGY